MSELVGQRRAPAAMSGDRGPRLALWFASAGLEVTCIYAWAAFTLTLIQDRPYSAWHAAGFFACASLLGSELQRAELRRGERAWLHGSGLLLLTLISAHAVLTPSGAWLSRWPADALSRAHPLSAWLALGATLFWSYTLWFSGAKHGAEPASYARVVSRFDRAVGWLFALFILKLLWRGHVSEQLADGVSGRLIAAFFLFCLVALAVARSRGNAQKRFAARYRALSGLMGVGAALGTCVLAWALLFLPQLRAALLYTYDALLHEGGPIGTAFAYAVFILLYLWMIIRGPHQAAPVLKEQKNFTDPRPVYREEAALKLIDDGTWLPWVAAGVCAALVLAFSVWAVRRYQRATAAQSLFVKLYRAWLRAWQRVAGLWARDERPDAVRLYVALHHWGRRSGVAARPSETPSEYGQRLQTHMPAVRAEIALIVSAFNAHTYAPTTQPRTTFQAERAALKRLRSLHLWPARLKLWLNADISAEPSEHAVSSQGSRL